jgi:hypothetical protein
MVPCRFSLNFSLFGLAQACLKANAPGPMYGSHPIRLLYLSVSTWATSSLAQRPDRVLKVILSVGAVLVYRLSVFQEEKRTGEKSILCILFYSFNDASSALGQFGNCLIRVADTSYNGTDCLCKLPGTEYTCKRVGGPLRESHSSNYSRFLTTYILPHLLPSLLVVIISPCAREIETKFIGCQAFALSTNFRPQYLVADSV